MKANDLMIGDWVNLYDSPIKINIDDLGVIERDETYDKGVHCEPIPLTEEILEKNGFKKVEKDLFHLGQSSIGVDTWLGIDNNVIYVDALYHDGEIAFCKCEYVHELQHALKMCGIDKEIIL